MQVGAQHYKARPTQGQLESIGLQTQDDYITYSITLLTKDAPAKMEELLAGANVDPEQGELKQVTCTATTQAGGMTEIQVREQALRLSPNKETEQAPEVDPEEEPTKEEEDAAGEGPTNSKVLNVSISYQENALPLHPFLQKLADTGGQATRDAIGACHKGANIHKPIPLDDSGTQFAAPAEILGVELADIIQRLPVFKCILFNIEFQYTTRRNLSGAATSSGIGELVNLSALPTNKLGSKFDAKRCKARFLGRDCTLQIEEKPVFSSPNEEQKTSKKWEVRERYLVERIPTWEEVTKEYEDID